VIRREKTHIRTRVAELQEEQLAIHKQATAEAVANAKVTTESLIAEAEAARRDRRSGVVAGRVGPQSGAARPQGEERQARSPPHPRRRIAHAARAATQYDGCFRLRDRARRSIYEIGRASCRERGEICVERGSLE